MKYAVINQQGGINRISYTKPQFTPDNATVIQISDADAALVTSGREAYPNVNYRWVDGTLMELNEAIELQRLLDTPIEDVKAARIKELEAACKAENETDLVVDGIGTFHVDPDTKIDLMTIKEIVAGGTSPMLVDGKYPNYKTVDGTAVDIGSTEITAIETALITRKFQAYSIKLPTLKAQVGAATTLQEVQAVKW